MNQGFKIYMINTLSLGITTFSKLETVLKIILLLITIGYTISKWIGVKKGRDE